MSTVSRSPDRHTFQAKGYIKRCIEKGEEPREDYLNMYKSAKQKDIDNINDPKWQINNLEYDLRSTEWILNKVRSNEVYAQNLYAAMCNNEFQKLDIIHILRDDKWSCSWRHSGGIIADMRQSGDYIDWYCSGIKDEKYNTTEVEMTEEILKRIAITKQFVGESCVTEEIRLDLKKLGWVVIDYDDCDS
jgi:hypothetical protein